MLNNNATDNTYKLNKIKEITFLLKEDTKITNRNLDKFEKIMKCKYEVSSKRFRKF